MRFIVLSFALTLWSCSAENQKQEKKPDAAAAPVTTTQPANNGGFGPNKGFGEDGNGTRSSTTKPKTTTTKPDDDSEDTDSDDEGEENDDAANKGSGSNSSNRFVKLQTEKCAKTTATTCKAYGLNAPRSKASFCPYTKVCADGKCKLTEVLNHFCNCIYQLEKGRTFFNGKEHDCVAEYQSAVK
jgi:hypothetical protein